MARNARSATRSHPLGTLGLLLMLLVARLAEPAYGRQATLAERVRGVAARRAIDAIAAVGWLVDHLAPLRAGPTSPGPRHAGRARMPASQPRGVPAARSR